MANWLDGSNYNKFRVSIPRYLSDNYFIEYEIFIQFPNKINWRIFKRYSDFLKLHEKLEKLDAKFKIYFPPKRLFNNTSDHFLNQRKKSLEMYMNEIILLINNYVPRPLARFLEMDKYEIHGITTNLANLLFKHGQALLMSQKTFEISVLSVHAINQRLLSPVPTNIYNKPKEDFGNVLDVIESTRSIKIVPQAVSVNNTSDVAIGTSNIKVESLTFDISIFSGAISLELNSLEMSNLRGLYKMNPVVEELKVHHCLKSFEDILFGDLICRGSSVDDLVQFDGPWRCCTVADFSNNSLTSIDTSVVTLKQVSRLNLSHNQISSIDNLQHLIFLTDLDLSYNNLSETQHLSLSSKLGSIRQLSLKGNKLSSLSLIDRMFSLEHLDISDNNIVDFASLLPLCRLTCLESLLIHNNPIGFHQSFEIILFDLFLDRLEFISINELTFGDLLPSVQYDIRQRRRLKETFLLDSSPSSSSASNQHLASLDTGSRDSLLVDPDLLLMSIDIDATSLVRRANQSSSVLLLHHRPDLFNRVIYWFHSAIGRVIVPGKLLWCTEIYSPNRCLKPSAVLLIGSSSLNACVLKCSITQCSRRPGQITIQARFFVDWNDSLRHLVIGAGKSFIRFDTADDNRSLYLVREETSGVEAFVGHMYHIDDEIVGFGDSRFVFLNEEDRLESLRRFIDVWRLDLIAALRRAGDNTPIKSDSESEILVNGRVMLQMQNGFQLLLTVVVTRQMLCLVDERIYDWPDIRKPLMSDADSRSLSHNFSPLSSSSSQFQFLRTNAYFFHQIKSCSRPSGGHLTGDNVLAELCPIFGHCVEILFFANCNQNKDPINLYFESDKKADKVCHIVNQLCEDQECKFSTSISIAEPSIIHSHKPHLPAEIVAHMKYLHHSFQEIRLTLSLQCPKLSNIAQLPASEIDSFCRSKMRIEDTAKIYGIVWCKFFYKQFDPTEDIEPLREETTGLLCISNTGIIVVYEIEDVILVETECWSDPESDQPESNVGIQTRLNTVTIGLESIFKIYVGMFYQWITIGCRSDANGSESDRLVLVTRNKDLSKQLVSWLQSTFNDQPFATEDQSKKSFNDIIEYRHDDSSNMEELLYQVRISAKCAADTELIHYTSVEDVRFDYQLSKLDNINGGDTFTYGVVISNEHISIIRHNIVEYPLRYFGPGAVRQSPKNLQYHIVHVIALYECLQLQLPGHDNNLLVIIVQSHRRDAMAAATFKIQLSINCQKEQKHLIDKLRHQWMKCLQVDTPLRVMVC